MNLFSMLDEIITTKHLVIFFWCAANLIRNDSFGIILEQSIIAENKLNKFIEEVKNEFKLENDKICLSGFSQGCMISINLGLTSKKKFNCVVGFSGKIINQDNLKAQHSLKKIFQSKKRCLTIVTWRIGN